MPLLSSSHPSSIRATFAGRSSTIPPLRQKQLRSALHQQLNNSCPGTDIRWARFPSQLPPETAAHPNGKTYTQSSTLLAHTDFRRSTEERPQTMLELTKRGEARRKTSSDEVPDSAPLSATQAAS